MKSSNNPPNIDPADNGTLAGLFRFLLNESNKNTDDKLPAQVISVDGNFVEVKIMILTISTGGEITTRAPIAHVPIFRLGAGGFFINFNPVPGDLGYVKACDRDISLFFQSYEASVPNTHRVHNFSDAVFIPNIMTGFTLDPTDGMSIQNLDGTIKIALKPDRIIVTAPIVEINGALAAEGGMTVSGGSAPQPLILTGDMLMIGDLRVVGAITASGSITPNVP